MQAFERGDSVPDVGPGLLGLGEILAERRKDNAETQRTLRYAEKEKRTPRAQAEAYATPGASIDLPLGAVLRIRTPL